MKVRTRYAPSPTGEPHIGNIRTALFAWLLARHHGGEFLLRIEDTDRARLVEGAAEAQMETLRWLGIDWDEGPDIRGSFAPYTQSERVDRYQSHAQQLIDTDWAYRCHCSPERLDDVRKEQQARKEPPRYDRFCRDLTAEERATKEGQPSVVRFKTPLTGETVTHDAIRGEMTFQNDTLDDFVLLKSDGYPTYHLAAIVDDHLMEITHVLRGEEWVSSLARHILIFRAFGWEPPVYAHVSTILGPDRAKLSKRHGAHAALTYRELGYLPEAIVNFLALLGWSLDDHTEIIDRETLIKHFSIERLLPNPAVFNAEKLEWMNGAYIRALSPQELAVRGRPYLEAGIGKAVDPGRLAEIVPLIQERIKLLTDVVEMADFFFAEGPLEYDASLLLGKRFAEEPEEARGGLGLVIAAAEGVSDWKHEALEVAIRPLAEGMGVKAGDLFGVVRVAVTGKTAAPPLFETMEVLGREVTLERLREAVGRLRSG
ncbi:MAG TPA: glutamate--tRNA ligase [Dehalococcoidia bacterium]|nr:glutamate--tRNA ligase [Dehalococcoidia bacterium]